MPTTLKRVQVTITPELDRVLKRAKQLWPGRPASQLVAQLATAGAGQVRPSQTTRRAVLQEMAESFRLFYPDGYLDELREDWE